MKNKQNSLSLVTDVFGPTVGKVYKASLCGKRRTFTERLNALQDAINKNEKGFRPGPGKTTSHPTYGKWRPA